MVKHAADLTEVYLQPGEAHLARGPTIIKTVLGSCVGVSIFASGLRFGALCHGVLPYCPPTVYGKAGYRYVDFSIRDLVRRLLRLGASRRELRIKVFGGADVIRMQNRTSRPTVGAQNIQAAFETLLIEGLTVASSDLGGPSGRSIRFDTSNGEVLVKRLPRVHD